MLAEILLSAGMLLGAPADGQTDAVTAPSGEAVTRTVIERVDCEGQADGEAADVKQVLMPVGEFC